MTKISADSDHQQRAVPHMTSDEFRHHGKAMVDWIADYLDRVETLPVQSQVEPGAIRARLPDAAPARGESFEAILGDVDDIILPGVTHWQSPSFFAYFPANSSPPAILGEMLSAGLGVQGMLWATSPACTELETHVLDWLIDMLGLPASYRSDSAGGGVLQDTASSSSLVALLCGRERATNFASNDAGVSASGLSGKGKLVAYTSTQAHSSIEKAMKIAGLGADSLRLIDVDDAFALRADELERQMLADIEAGFTPCFVCATIGTTSSTAVDPIRAIGEICQRHGAWLHVDAAMAGTASLCPEFRQHQDGVELADSYSFNPHKWMLTNFDCNAFWVTDRSILIKTLSVLPEYLRNQATESGAVFDYRDWHIPLGRRFRALKLWFVIRSYGVEGLQALVRNHIDLAQQFRQWVIDDDDFIISAPTPFNLVCFRHRGGDEINRRILDRLNASGKLYLSHTVLGGHYTLRLSIGQTYTEAHHVEAAWQAVRNAGDAIG